MNCLTKTVLVVSAVVLTCLGAEAAGARGQTGGSRPAADWWNPAAPYRLKVSVDAVYPERSRRSEWEAFDRLNTGRLTALVEVHLRNPASVSSQKSIRVVDERGKVVPCRVYYLNNPETVTVLFAAPRSGGDFYVYYGGESPDQPAPNDWLPATTSLTLTTLKIATETLPRTLLQIRDALQRRTSLQGKKSLNLVAAHVNPVRLEAGNHKYLTCIEGLVNCEVGGEYTFALDSGGHGFLLIDGKLVASSEGAHRPSNKWQSSQSAILKSGYHHLRVMLSEMSAFQGVRLGWQPPGKNRIDVMPAEAFTKYVKARPVEFGRADKKEAAYFTFVETTVAFKVRSNKTVPAYHLAHLPRREAATKPETKTVMSVGLKNLSTFDDGRGGVEYVWKINTVRREATGRQTTVALELGKSYRIRLEAYRSDKCVGSLERAYRPYTHSVARPRWRLETIGAPNIVFVGEQESLSFRVRSSVTGAMSLDWDYVLRSPGGSAVLDEKSGVLDCSSPEESALTIPLDTDLYGQDSEIVVVLRAAGMPLASSLFHVMPVGPKIERLEAGVGCLVDEDGNRVILSTHLIDPAAFRKWVVPRALKRLLSSSNTRILLYGCRMENTLCSGEECTSYVSFLRDQCSAAAKGFDFVKRSDSMNGVLADLPAFGKILGQRDPDTVVISPGLSDIMRGVPVRDFKRSIQVMLNLVRARNSAIRMILVSPPPLPTNVKLSELYRDAMAEVAETNRATFADIHFRLSSEGHLKYYKSALDDAVHYTHPNNDGQQAMAQAIWHYIR